MVFSHHTILLTIPKLIHQQPCNNLSLFYFQGKPFRFHLIGLSICFSRLPNHLPKRSPTFGIPYFSGNGSALFLSCSEGHTFIIYTVKGQALIVVQVGNNRNMLTRVSWQLAWTVHSPRSAEISQTTVFHFRQTLYADTWRNVSPIAVICCLSHCLNALFSVCSNKSTHSDAHKHTPLFGRPKATAEVSKSDLSTNLCLFGWNMVQVLQLICLMRMYASTLSSPHRALSVHPYPSSHPSLFPLVAL